jgi:hypothetical protein
VYAKYCVSARAPGYDFEVPAEVIRERGTVGRFTSQMKTRSLLIGHYL